MDYYKQIDVMTIDESFNEPYDNARNFYYSLGFVKKQKMKYGKGNVRS